MIDEKMSINTLFKAKQAILESKLSILLEHPVTKGEHCESAWIDFFRSFLPSKYAVEKGFVFDAQGNVSEQIDVIIYDALYTPLIFGTDAGDKYVTAESVYAVFDSKPKIDKETIVYTNKKVSSVSKLVRSSREMVNAGKVVSPRTLTHIIGGILAVDSVRPETIKSYMPDNQHIDVGCAIKVTSFFVYRNEEGSIVNFKSSSQEESILAFFYIILDALYRLGTVAGIDILDYSDKTLTSLQLDREDI